MTNFLEIIFQDCKVYIFPTDIVSNDSDIECSQSVCSDTHSDNTSASGLTDKSTVSDSTIHALSGASETDNKGIQGPVTPGKLTPYHEWNYCTFKLHKV